MYRVYRIGAKISLAPGLMIAAASQASAAATPGSVTPGVEFVVSPAMSNDLSPISMYLGADWVVQSVIIALMIASLLTWTICVAKALEFRIERRRLKQAIQIVMKATDLTSAEAVDYGPVADMLVNAEDEIAMSNVGASGRAMADGAKDRIGMRLDRIVATLNRRLGRGMALLAIIGATSPFIGLFGTVWGIMNSFIGIAESKTTNLAVVAPGIAEALLTTAVGLIAAIPAVIIYNLFARVLTACRGELTDASAVVQCLAGREIDLSSERP